MSSSLAKRFEQLPEKLEFFATKAGDSAMQVGPKDALKVAQSSGVRRVSQKDRILQLVSFVTASLIKAHSFHRVSQWLATKFIGFFNRVSVGFEYFSKHLHLDV